jgi:uncharacterized protein involved in exopolysaccharide biosynthesis/Mrp family chromosome partitioning ATPase
MSHHLSNLIVRRANGGSGDASTEPMSRAVVRTHWLQVLGIATGLTLAVACYTLLSGMRFVATGQLYLGETESHRGPAPNLNDFSLTTQDESEVASELEILQSRSLVKRAVLTSALNVHLSHAKQTTVPYWRWRLSGRDSRLLDGALNEVRPHETTLPRSVLTPRRFRVHFDDGTHFQLWSNGIRVATGEIGRPLATDVLTLTLEKGDEGEAHAGAEYDLVVSPLDRTIDDASKILKVSAPKSSAAGESINVVTLEFGSTSPHLAATFLSSLMSIYLAERQAWKVEDASAAESFVTGQLESIRHSLADIESRLAEYRRGNHAVVLDDEGKAMVEELGKYEQERAAARLEVSALGSVQQALASTNPPKGAFLLGEADDPVFAKMATSLSEARQTLAELEQRYNDAAPEVRQQRAQVEAQIDGIRNYVSSRYMRAQQNFATLTGIIQQFNDDLKTVPAAVLGLAQLTRESEVYSKTYAYLLERQQQAGIVKASTLSKNRILYTPEPPLQEDSPNLVLRGLAFPIGAFVGAALVILQALFGSRFSDDDDVRRRLGGIEILATIPRQSPLKRGYRRLGKSSHGEPQVATEFQPDERFFESFRTARARLHHWKGPDLGARVIAVTSPCAHDGKTTCAFALARALSASGASVLVVDTDVRKSSRFGEGLGLGQALAGNCEWTQAVSTVTFPEATFELLAPGDMRWSPDLMSLARLGQLVDRLRKAFDFVVIDSASFPVVSDALVVSQVADATVTVIRPGHTTRMGAESYFARVGRLADTHFLMINGSEGAS